MTKSLIIIGAGMGGMAAGIYGQLNGYRTRIFEMHSRPGGQCASWQRQGYTFDACIHHLMGCSPDTGVNRFWTELGAMPRELAYPRECTSVISPDGKHFYDYYDPELLAEHLHQLAPPDAQVIGEYVRAIKLFARCDPFGPLMQGSTWAMVKSSPALFKTMKWFRQTMADFAGRFSDPFLRRAFPLLEYSTPSVPLGMHLAKHGYGFIRDIAWPIGASARFAGSIAERYTALGGELNCSQKVVKILTENGRAVGVKLADGSEERADIVISNADGRKTLLDLLEGRYLDDRLKAYCADPPDEINWAVHVFLGVNRDLSAEPSSLIMLLESPVTIAGHETDALEIQLYGLDPTMAPAGKGVIKVALVSRYSYWKELARDRSRYEEEKEKVARQVIDLLENYFHGIGRQVEVIDVPTLLTWERFMGGTHGFNNMPAKKAYLGGLFNNSGMFVPGLKNFYFVGSWATSTGALFINALSGKKAIMHICRKDGKKFAAG